MIDNILRLLELDDYYGISDNIEIAKGKNKLNTSFFEAWEQRKREKWLQK